MKKINNKAFAASALIYGLSILSMMVIVVVLSIASTTRKNTKDIVQTIEEDLNRISKIETVFLERSTAQEYMVSENGWYKIEIWGKNPKKYATGLIRLYEKDKLNFLIKNNEVKVTSSGNDIMSIKKDGSGNDKIYISGYLDNQRQAEHYLIDGLVLDSGMDAAQAKIKKIGNINDVDMRKNQNMNNIKEIKDCIFKADNPVWTKIVAMYQGSDASAMYEEETTDEGDMTCKKMLFNSSSTYDIDELTIWHEQKDYKKHSTTVIYGNNTSKVLISSGEYTETASGVRISAYQQPAILPLENGEYYIIPAQDESKVIGLSNSSSTMQGVTSSSLQKWKITKIEGTNNYRIMNMKDNKFLNCSGSQVTATNQETNSNFTITGMEDNTYQIECIAKKVYVNGEKLALTQHPSDNSYKFKLIYMY